MILFWIKAQSTRYPSKKKNADFFFSGNIFKEFPIEEEIKDNEILGVVSGMWMKVVKFDEEVFTRFNETKMILEEKSNKILEGNENGRVGNCDQNVEILKGKEKMNRWSEIIEIIKRLHHYKY